MVQLQSWIPLLSSQRVSLHNPCGCATSEVRGHRYFHERKFAVSIWCAHAILAAGTKQACCADVFPRPTFTGPLGETPDKRRFALGRKPRVAVYATGVLGLRAAEKAELLRFSSLGGVKRGANTVASIILSLI